MPSEGERRQYTVAEYQETGRLCRLGYSVRDIRKLTDIPARQISAMLKSQGLTPKPSTELFDRNSVAWVEFRGERVLLNPFLDERGRNTKDYYDFLKAKQLMLNEESLISFLKTRNKV